MMDQSVVTWGEVGALLGFSGMVVLAVLGWAVRQIANIGAKVETQRDLIESNHREVIRYYATQEMVTQVDKRLTEALNQVSGNITDGMSQITARIEALFTTLLKERDRD